MKVSKSFCHLIPPWHNMSFDIWAGASRCIRVNPPHLEWGLFASEKSVHTALSCQAQLPKVSLKIMLQNFQNYNNFQIENCNLIKLDQDNLKAWPCCPFKKRALWIFVGQLIKTAKIFILTMTRH